MVYIYKSTVCLSNYKGHNNCIHTVKYYVRQESNVYTAYVDASRAFNCVRHDKLFMVLIDRELPPIVI